MRPADRSRDRSGTNEFMADRNGTVSVCLDRSARMSGVADRSGTEKRVPDRSGTGSLSATRSENLEDRSEIFLVVSLTSDRTELRPP